jgi:hypothetical protein
MSTTTDPPAGPAVPTGWYRPSDCDLADFRRVVEQTTDLGDYRYADDVAENVVVYGERLRTEVRDPESRREVQAELARALQSGPGVVGFRGLHPTDRGPEAGRRSRR